MFDRLLVNQYKEFTMLPVILGGVALTAVGYGVARFLEDECHCSKSKEIEVLNADALKKFYQLRQTVFETSYTKLEAMLNEIQNLNIEDKVEIVFTNVLPKTNVYHPKVEKVASQLYILLEQCHSLFEPYVSKVSDILRVSNNYTAYSKEAKNTLSDALMLSHVISDILNVELIDTNNQPIESSEQLIEEIQKMIEETFKEESSEFTGFQNIYTLWNNSR